MFNNKKEFLKNFTINKKLYSDISEDIKRKIFFENTQTIKGLSENDRLFIARYLYDCEIDCKSSYNLIDLRNFLLDKLKLKYKYLAMQILENQLHKAHSKLYRIELLQNNITKANWIYMGGTCKFESHKKYNRKIFDLEKGLFDEGLKKYIFPTDLENCDCNFLPIIE